MLFVGWASWPAPFLLSEGTMVPAHRIFVRRDVAGELVAARAIGPRDEVQRIAVRGRECRANTGQPGIGDRAGGESGVTIGVVGMAVIQIATVDAPAIAVLQEGRVDRGRIAIQLHASPQTIDKY